MTEGQIWAAPLEPSLSAVFDGSYCSQLVPTALQMQTTKLNLPTLHCWRITVHAKH